MGTQQILKIRNRASILNTIRQNSAISRADLARQLGLSVGAVTKLTGELIQDGLIYEKQEGDSRGGRPPILLSLYPDGAYVVGAKLMENHIMLALTNLDGDVVKRETIVNDQRDPDHVAQLVSDGIKALMKHANMSASRLIGAGIGMAGIVDAERGVCRSSPILGWKNVPFAALVEQRTGLPVMIDNDVNTLTQVERLYGKGIGSEHFLTVTIGRGIGLGIVAHGQLYRGMGGAGEFGHTVLDPNGYQCDCGKHGCLETFVGDPWLLRRAAEQGLDAITADDLAAEAFSGDSKAIAILEQAGQMLGRGLSILVNILNPQLIIFSGEGIRYGDFLLQPARESLFANAMSGLTDGLRLHVEPLGDDAWARGAASIVLQELFRTSQSELARMGSD